jgi:hypothetical protein
LKDKCRLRVFENRVLRIFGPKRDEVTGEWRRLYNKELYALYTSSNIIRVIKLRRLSWAGHVAGMEESIRIRNVNGELIYVAKNVCQRQDLVNTLLILFWSRQCLVVS